MSINIAQLEQAWLRAEAAADDAKRDVAQANDYLHRVNGKVVDAAAAKELMSAVEEAKSRLAEAESEASAAFDLLWQAKGQGQQSIHA
ncbi:MAG: hypothetical protein AB7O43_09970 [Hyphomicrobiaceae bacterium]